MNKKFLKNLLVLSVATIMTLSMVACGGTSGNSSSGSNGSTSGGASGSNNKLVYNLAMDPQTIDPSLNTIIAGNTVIRALFEGLVRQGDDGVPVPGCIKEMPNVSDDGLIYTFKIRDDANWSDGKPVKAQDFEYSFFRTLDPNVGAEYANLFNYIKNAEKFYNGEVQKDEVGIKSVDDKTLEITLENPSPFFLQVLTIPVFMPLREDIVGKAGENSSDAWSRDPKTCIGNGAFTLKEWQEKDHITLEKNKDWYGASDVKLDEISFLMIENASTAVAAFRSGEIDVTSDIPSSDVQAFKDEGVYQETPSIGLMYLSINLSDKLKEKNPDVYKALSNVKVRKALALALDREGIVSTVTGTGEKPAMAFVPYGIPDDKGKEFNNKNYFKDNDITEAKKLLSEAGYPDGQGFPKIELLTTSAEASKKAAEAYQDMWKTNLGIDVDIVQQESKVYLQVRRDKEFMFCRTSWVGDFADAINFLEILQSDSGNNVPGYNNPAYDEKIKASLVEPDNTKRIALLREAQDILMEDMPVIPIYFDSNAKVVQKYVKGFNYLSTSTIYFDKVYIEK